MEENFWRTKDWWTSPFNFLPVVRDQFDLPQEVQIHDATLRDGEQTPGIVLRKEDKVEIAAMLDAIGVHRIEAGMACCVGRRCRSHQDHSGQTQESEGLLLCPCYGKRC